MKIYPSAKFHKFGSNPAAYIVNDSEINTWIKECITRLEKNKKQNEALTATGDTLVTVSRLYYDHTDDSDYYYEAIVSRNYEQAMIERDQFEHLKM